MQKKWKSITTGVQTCTDKSVVLKTTLGESEARFEHQRKQFPHCAKLALEITPPHCSRKDSALCRDGDDSIKENHPIRICNSDAATLPEGADYHNVDDDLPVIGSEEYQKPVIGKRVIVIPEGPGTERRRGAPWRGLAELQQ